MINDVEEGMQRIMCAGTVVAGGKLRACDTNSLRPLRGHPVRNQQQAAVHFTSMLCSTSVSEEWLRGNFCVCVCRQNQWGISRVYPTNDARFHQ